MFATRNSESRARLFSKTLIFYSLFSALQFNLIYDRVDILMVLSLIGIFLFWESLAGLNLVIGFLVKLVPMGFWPFKFKELWSQNRKRALLSLWIPLAGFVLLYASDFIFPGELAALSKHTTRGIQLESLWATPFLILHILGFDTSGSIQLTFGAQEIQSDLISETVLTISKYFGFVMLALVYVFAGSDMKTLASRNRVFLIFILTFLCFQRVLSTQFLLWTAPFLALSLALEFNWFIFILALVIFALTAAIFDPGYGPLVRYDEFWVSALAIRNSLLVILLGLYLGWRRLIPRIIS